MNSPRFRVGDRIVVKEKLIDSFEKTGTITKYEPDAVRGRNYYEIDCDPLLHHESYLEFEEIYNSPLYQALLEDEDHDSQGS